jgi:hypothetical protein
MQSSIDNQQPLAAAAAGKKRHSGPLTIRYKYPTLANHHDALNAEEVSLEQPYNEVGDHPYDVTPQSARSSVSSVDSIDCAITHALRERAHRIAVEKFVSFMHATRFSRFADSGLGSCCSPINWDQIAISSASKSMVTYTTNMICSLAFLAFSFASVVSINDDWHHFSAVFVASNIGLFIATFSLSWNFTMFVVGVQAVRRANHTVKTYVANPTQPTWIPSELRAYAPGMVENGISFYAFDAETSFFKPVPSAPLQSSSVVGTPLAAPSR